jgi:hypothetical protein
MVACTFHAFSFEMAKILGMPIPLEICTLGNVTCVPWRFEMDFALLQIFHLKYFLVVWGRPKVYKERRERLFSSVVFGVPDIGNGVPEFSNFGFDVVRINGVIHVFNTTR